MRWGIHLSDYEQIALPLQWHRVIHYFSDRHLCQTSVHAYSLEEILAEKLRSWIQRTRPRDLFDVVKILQSGSLPISKVNILNAFFQKTLFKQVPLAAVEEMLFDHKFATVQQNWAETIICPPRAAIVAVNAVRLFRDFVTAVFDPEFLQQLGIRLAPGMVYPYDVRSGVREAIIEAGKARQLVRLRYHHGDRDVEPYSFRFKWTQRGYGAEYFYGFDRTRGNKIKSFFLHEIQGASIVPTAFLPRWLVEF